jgi:hypothetical protein
MPAGPPRVSARREGETGRALEFGVDRILDGLARYAES